MQAPPVWKAAIRRRERRDGLGGVRAPSGPRWPAPNCAAAPSRGVGERFSEAPRGGAPELRAAGAVPDVDRARKQAGPPSHVVDVGVADLQRRGPIRPERRFEPQSVVADAHLAGHPKPGQELARWRKHQLDQWVEARMAPLARSRTHATTLPNGRAVVHGLRALPDASVPAKPDRHPRPSGRSSATTRVSSRPQPEQTRVCRRRS